MKKLYIPIMLVAGLSLSSFGQSAKRQGNQTFTEETISINPSEVTGSLKPSGDNSPVTEKSKNEIKGDKLYFIYSYTKAIELYKKEETLTFDGQRKLAKCYYNMNQAALASEAYAKLINATGGNVPEDYYNYSMALKAEGKYDLAGAEMDKFVALKPADLRAQDYAANKSELNTLLKDNGKYKLKHLELNTDAEDFGPAFYKNKIVFASSRTVKTFPKNSYRNGKPYLNIYVADVDKDQLKTPENFDKSLNGSMNEGPASFSKDGLFMAYTKNDYDLPKKEKVVNVEIYFRTFTKDKWSKPEAFSVNNEAYSVGHPSLSNDGRTMYFTSDMPGGYGGADIYRVTKSGTGNWSSPENLGNTINTEGDEVFPFYEEKRGILFFASNGHFGLGGLDIFSSSMKGSVFARVSNMGSPLNTSSDDFSMIVDSSVTKGYFATNRKGGSGDDDIYSVEFLNVKELNGIAKDVNENPLASTFITLLDDKGLILDTLTTLANGAFSFTVDTDRNFKLKGSKETYNDGSNVASTFGPVLIVKADVTLLMPVKKAEVIAPKIEVGHDLAKIVDFKPIYFDYHEYTIRPFAEVELNKIVKVMNENPGMTVELKAYTDCRASYAYNQALSERRAKASADYIKKRITDPSRIYGKGYGETRLITNCACDGKEVSRCSEDDHQLNRRTEFIVIKKGTPVNP